MAFISQEDKKAKLAKIKAILPKGWTASASINNYSALNITIRTPDITVFDLDVNVENFYSCHKRHYLQKNQDLFFCVENKICLDSRSRDLVFLFGKEHAAVLEQIYDIANEGNYNNSDAYTDYYDVGFYLHIYVEPSKKALKDNVYYGIRYSMADDYNSIIKTFYTDEEEFHKAKLQ